MANFEIEGMSTLNAVLRASPARAMEALAGSLWREANRIMTDSKGEVPVKQGILRASGTVFMPVIEGLTVEVVLGYGGAAQAYAVIQHERTDFHHTVGKAHYLLDPMEQHAEGMDARLAADIDVQNLFPGLP